MLEWIIIILFNIFKSSRKLVLFISDKTFRHTYFGNEIIENILHSLNILY